MAKPQLLLTGLLLAAALAGCSGDDGKSDVNSVSTSTQTNVGNTTLSGSFSVGPGGTAGNASVSDPNGTASMSWSYDNRSGTISGNGALVNVPFTAEEMFTVENGTATLNLNLSVEGNELRLSVRAPDCEDSDCAEEVETTNGVASMTVDNPAEGAWTAVLELEGTGPVKADYELEIAQFGPGASA